MRLVIGVLKDRDVLFPEMTKYVIKIIHGLEQGSIKYVRLDLIYTYLI